MASLDYGVLVIKKENNDKCAWFSSQNPIPIEIENRKAYLYKNTLSFDNKNHYPILEYKFEETPKRWQDTTRIFSIKNGYAKSRFKDQAIETEIHLGNGIKYFILQGYDIHLKKWYKHSTKVNIKKFVRRYVNIN
ncbi:hypothetical protein Terranova_197 [Staphylococcus phage Terranova]|nr:hypothetical protein Terranova_197 [Staphylococcus phage Terranova]